ncbi:MAG: TetR/AcrR family transcriptional regulator [Marinoscillum sp.]|uniref:TetR/AcrR family transcriptional regulator n=1 Tax=Marinoscillum sp. TaxID=2024838 RepID=UPI0032FC29B6
MRRDGKATRDRILAESKALIYENGFAGTSIDLILQKTGITKGAFFYHFKTKAELALVLMNEFASADLEELANVMSATEAYEDQPKRRLLEFIQCFIDMFSDLKEPPNCLYASVSNEQNQYDEEIKEVVKETMIKWRIAFEDMIDKVLECCTPKVEVDKVVLADHFNVVVEGAYIVSKAINDPSLTAKHLMLYKNYLDMVFDEGN